MTRPRKHTLLLPAAVAAVLLGACVTLAALFEGGRDHARFDRVRDGMTQEEATAVTGRPLDRWW